MKIKVKFMLFAVIILALSWEKRLPVFADGKEGLRGQGTKKEPYLISDVNELLFLANSVNEGNCYEGKYVLQTDNIDLSGIEWPTIGLYDSDYSFAGIYDGGGFMIRNLSVSVGGNNSFFGKLGGTVINLGIESGNISGTCVGGITSHSSNENALIANCYNRATVVGTRAGGIADNFNGTIANSWSNCELISDSNETMGGIVSFDAKSIINCYSIEENGRSGVSPGDCTLINYANCDLFEVAEALNKEIYYVAAITNTDYHDFYFWTVSEDGNHIIFSNEKGHFKWKYIFSYAKAVVINVIPYIIIGSSLLIFIFSLIKVSKKEPDTV